MIRKINESQYSAHLIRLLIQLDELLVEHQRVTTLLAETGKRQKSDRKTFREWGRELIAMQQQVDTAHGTMERTLQTVTQKQWHNDRANRLESTLPEIAEAESQLVLQLVDRLASLIEHDIAKEDVGHLNIQRKSPTSTNHTNTHIGHGHNWYAVRWITGTMGNYTHLHRTLVDSCANTALQHHLQHFSIGRRLRCGGRQLTGLKWHRNERERIERKRDRE